MKRNTVKKLKQEKRELRQAKEDPSQFLEERKIQVQKQIDNKKLFMFGGITRKLNEDGTPSYSVEIPHPDKKVRNIKLFNDLMSVILLDSKNSISKFTKFVKGLISSIRLFDKDKYVKFFRFFK